MKAENTIVTFDGLSKCFFVAQVKQKTLIIYSEDDKIISSEFSKVRFTPVFPMCGEIFKKELNGGPTPLVLYQASLIN